MNISIFGLGYVGSVTAACLAREGHRVTGVDENPAKVEMVNQGRSPVIEKDLDEMMAQGVKTGRITALDLPGQVEQALAIGLLNASEAQLLLEYDRKVMDIVNVDDFTTEELMAGVQAGASATPLRQIA